MRLTFAKTVSGTAALLAAGLLLTQSPALSAEQVVHAPAPAVDVPVAPKLQTAVFAGGCFWGVQGVYQHVKGVTSVVSGYSGGSKETAKYRRVGQGDTGHAEAVRITYDPRQVSYGRLLQIFFSVVADPTTLNRQGPDVGTQYRTAIFPTTPAQAKVAAAYIAQVKKSGVWKRPVVTRVESFKGFYPAEAYHQDFLVENPTYPYIVYNDIPKVEALKSNFPQMWREKPVLVKKG